ncbi:MAG: PLD nuclease N-terminal domain-containing protein [Coriobacteriia bacterium]
MEPLANISAGLLVAFGVLIVVQLVLQVTALVSLWRLPSERVSLGGRKWAWALIIILGELVGPVLYFAVGRLPAPAPAESTSPVPGGTARARNAVEALYGPQGQPGEDGADGTGADGTGMGELP